MTLATKPVTRETLALSRRRPLIVELTAHAAILREKGRRHRVTVPWGAVYDLGMKLQDRARRAEKAAKKGKR